MTVGSLRDQIIYPDNLEIMKSKKITDDDIVELLKRVNLEWIVSGDDGDDVKSVGKRRSLDDSDNWIDVLSGGQKQRVAIARAIVGQPEIILADEPTGNLDSSMGSEIMDILIQLNETERTTIVMVTHDEHMAKKTHRLVRLFDGSQVQ